MAPLSVREPDPYASGTLSLAGGTPGVDALPEPAQLLAVVDRTGAVA
jgi:hypothetical protein